MNTIFFALAMIANVLAGQKGTQPQAAAGCDATDRHASERAECTAPAKRFGGLCPTDARMGSGRLPGARLQSRRQRRLRRSEHESAE